VENTDDARRDTLLDEVKVNLDVFCPLVLDQVRREVDGTHVVAVDDCSTLKGLVEFLEKLAKPRRLGHAICNSALLGLCTGARDGLLALAGPGDEAVTKKHVIP
jgi:hypothetical protein